MRNEQAGERQIIPFPAPLRQHPDVRDLRFRTLLGPAAWDRLPSPVKARFGKHVGGCSTAIYKGEIVECRMSRLGWLLAQLARLIGGPLPLGEDVFTPATVTVTEDPASGGQFWTRLYGRHRGFPQVIHSAKRFAGPTGLEEYIGCGFGIALKLRATDQALEFLSDHYFFRLGALRLRLPRWMAPGSMCVSHIECGHGTFAFVLNLVHPLLGELVHQTVMFEDVDTGTKV